MQAISSNSASIMANRQLNASQALSGNSTKNNIRDSTAAPLHITTGSRLNQTRIEELHNQYCITPTAIMATTHKSVVTKFAGAKKSINIMNPSF
ncbi:hypothetical protein EVA_12119 [gut metagenome]|uniref:Uncharacterized protein n=1 Tax=gut metagenome TaxID=749906 RepID=J9FYW3_9ZZZZ